MPIETLSVSDDAFDAALERFAVVDEMLTPKADLGREPERKEILDRLQTAFGRDTIKKVSFRVG